MTHYLTQEGLQVIPVQNRLMTSRIVPRLDPRKIGGQPSFHTSAGVITAEAGLPTEGQGWGQWPCQGSGCYVLLQVGPWELNSNIQLLGAGQRQSGHE